MANNVFNIKTNLQVQYYLGSTWTSIEADSYDLNIDRGITVDQGVFARPDIGLATVRLSKKSLSDLITGPAYKSNQPFRIRYQPSPDTSPSVYYTIFYGFIQNVSMSFNVDSQKLDIVIQANDTTKILTNSRVDVFSITGTLTNRSFRTQMDLFATKLASIDSRISLSQAGSGGSSSNQYATTFIDVQSGEVLNQFLDGELGWCYSQRSGANQFYLTRTDINALQGTTWSTSNATISNIHSSSTLHYCMDNIDLQYDSDTLVNDVKLIETNSTPASDKTATNATSITDYGTQSANFEVNMDPGASPYTRMSDWVNAVAAAADPKSISMVSCPAIRRDGVVSGLADIEIAYPLQVEFVDPNNSSNYIRQISLVTRINHVISADHWEINLGLWKGI